MQPTNTRPANRNFLLPFSRSLQQCECASQCDAARVDWRRCEVSSHSSLTVVVVVIVMSATAILQLPSINARTLDHTTTRHNADVVHTLPDAAAPSSSSSSSSSCSLVAVGNYELDTTSGVKVGGIALYEVDAAAGRLMQRSYCATSAIFDLQWREGLIAGKSLLACADAAGAVSVIQLVRDEQAGNGSSSGSSGSIYTMAPVATLDVYGGSGASCLSIDWNDGNATAAGAAAGGGSASHSSSSSSALTSPSIATSSSTGSVSVLTLNPSSSSLSLLATCTPHSLEVWSCAFSPHCSTSLYSGGDDCLLFHTDTRSMQQPTLLSSAHTAGVCCVLPSAELPHVLATGCYDERVRVWDTRAMRRPVGEQRLNGGVWRLRWGRSAVDGSEDAGRLLCCCMHAGVQLVELTEGGAALRVVSEYYEHQSLAYGGDWVTVQQQQRGEATDEQQRYNAVVSCSFYDSSVRLWQPTDMETATAGSAQ